MTKTLKSLIKKFWEEMGKRNSGREDKLIETYQEIQKNASQEDLIELLNVIIYQNPYAQTLKKTS